MNINLLILQPKGYIHSLCFLDTARYLRHHLRRHRIEASISKNRPRPDALNIIFGAHLGMPAEWLVEFQCVIFNQEQLGAGGPDLPDEYLNLLRNAHTIDYDPANLAAYANGKGVVPGYPTRTLLPLRHASYLESLGSGFPIHSRPINILFFGSLNQERIALIQRIEQSGVEVSRFDHPMYGPERDEYIAQAKAVLNIPFYGSNRFEQVRVFNALSIGTPVVSLRRTGLSVDAAYEDTVHWFEEEHVQSYFGQCFGTPNWLLKSEAQLARWRHQDADGSISALVEVLTGIDAQMQVGRQNQFKQCPTRLNLAGSTHYRPGWVNINSKTASINPHMPVADHPHDPPAQVNMPVHSMPAQIAPGRIVEIHTTHELASTSELRHLLSNATTLLKDGATITLDCPLGVYAPEAQELHALHQRALGIIRLTLDDMVYATNDCTTLQLEDVRSVQEATASGQGQRYSIRFVMQKRTLTPREVVAARCHRLDFGKFPEDLVAG